MSAAGAYRTVSCAQKGIEDRHNEYFTYHMKEYEKGDPERGTPQDTEVFDDRESRRQ